MACDLVDQRRPLHAECPGRGRDDMIGRLQRRLDQTPFHILDDPLGVDDATHGRGLGAGLYRRGRRRRRVADKLGCKGGIDAATGREHAGAHDEGPELPDVAGPGIGAQPVPRLRTEIGEGRPRRRGQRAEQRVEIADPVRQRRRRQRQHRKPEVKVLAKLAR
ncbi:MAG: hypothetical protein INF91_08890, partial [Alphaproteobacteria bacterium]|nr:hypothetical protein [Alphaproteobacteria bacterium]